jgi:aspartate/tyrosine/aromatic aminotransferase
VWVSDPTWDNHRAMFEGAGLAVHTYPYYDAATGGLRFDDMLQTLRGLPAQRGAAARLLPQPDRASTSAAPSGRR